MRNPRVRELENVENFFFSSLLEIEIGPEGISKYRENIEIPENFANSEHVSGTF